MEPNLLSVPELLAEVRSLREHLSEAQDTLHAIQNGEVDALVVTTNKGEQVFTLRGADHTYRLLVEAMNEGAATLSDSGVVLYCNSRFAAMTGIPLHSVIGSEFSQYIASAERDDFHAFIREGMRGNTKKEFQLLANSAIVPVILSINVLNIEVPILCLVITDLTESKHALQAIQYEQKRLEELAQIEHQQRLFAEGMAQASIALTSTLNIDELFDRILTQISKVIPFDFAYISLLDRDEFEVVRIFNPDPSQVYPNLVNERCALSQFPHLGKIMETRHTIAIHKVTDNPDWMHSTGWEWVDQFICAPLVSKEVVIGFLNLYCKLPDRLNAEHIGLIDAFASQAALAIQNVRLYTNLEVALKNEHLFRNQLIQTEKFAAIGRMVASITHELNNPLQSIKNCLYLTREELVDTGEHEFLSMASEEVQRLTKLVSQLRDTYRPRQSASEEWIELSELLEQVRNLVSFELHASGIVWNMKPCQGEFRVKGSPDQLKQVFLNIVWNAIQAIKPDRGELFVDFLDDPQNCQVGVSIKDTGPGIAPQNLTKLFEPLFTTKTTGVGLGLPISLNIVQSHGGRIEVESQPKAGATFTVWLPKGKTLG
jgi:two-component system, OmpR family, phosphate regulon sensor histidine kinase PhoR